MNPVHASTFEGKFETKEEFYTAHMNKVKEEIKLLWPVLAILVALVGFIFWKATRSKRPGPR